MTKTLSMHPLVKGISPSRWENFSDSRRSFENRKAVREYYELQARYAAHWYVGFESLPGVTPAFSRIDTDHLERAKRDCAWVWGKREKMWLKKPEVQS